MVAEMIYLSIVPYLLSFALLSVFSKPLRKYASLLSISLSFISFIMIVAGILGFKQPFESNLSWLSFGSINFQLGFAVDNLSILFAFLISLVSLLVLVYSHSYMKPKDNPSRFYAEMGLFAGSMIGLVMSSNFITLFIFWEIVGLSSYLLIGFWHYRKQAAAAAKRAFVIIILGDVFMFAGIALLALNFPSLSFSFLNSIKTSSPALAIAMSLILIGAVSKSAQFPLHVWLGDAMEGPTPVSTLLHSATMVKAGIFLVARLLPLYALVQLLSPISIIGAASAFIGATIAFSELDIKRVLAFSTVSQLGFMMLALGTNSLGSSMLYSFTQTFSKSAIFMIAGIIMHAFDDKRDLRKIFLSPRSKVFIIALLGFFAMSGLPPFGDFWGKDSVLGSAFNYSSTAFAFMLITSFVSALYISRWFFMQLGNYVNAKSRSRSHILRQIPRAMLVPTILLLSAAIISGIFSTFIFSLFNETESINIILYLESTVVAAFAIAASYFVFYKKAISPQVFTQLPVLGAVYKIFYNKYWLDVLYRRLALGFVNFVFNSLDFFDRFVVDGVVNSFYGLGNLLADNFKKLHSGITQNYIAGIFLGIVLLIILLDGIRIMAGA